MTTPRRTPVKHLTVVAHNFQADRASVGRQRQVAALDVLLLVQMAGRVLVQKHGRVRVHVVRQLVDAGAERLLQRQGVLAPRQDLRGTTWSRHRAIDATSDSTRDTTGGSFPCASSQIRNMTTTRLMESWRSVLARFSPPHFSTNARAGLVDTPSTFVGSSAQKASMTRQSSVANPTSPSILPRFLHLSKIQPGPMTMPTLLLL